MLHLILVFAHLLATSIALGAIIATDLRMLSKLADDRVRIAPPNAFVARLVSLALVLLYVTGGALLWLDSRTNPDFFHPKLQGKLLLVGLLTLNAVVLHRFTFPRLARGRRLARWRFGDALVVVLPVALSNCLWMFCAFLGIARPWNHTIELTELLGIAAALYAVSLFAVAAILWVASRPCSVAQPNGMLAVCKRFFALVGRLGEAAPAPSSGAARRGEPSFTG